MEINDKFSTESMNRFGASSLPGYLGIEITRVADGEVAARLPIQPHLLAPNGYLHAGTVVSLADTAAGYACVARPAHMGKTTQVWDVLVSNEANGKTIALFRCTQMILYPAASA